MESEQFKESLSVETSFKPKEKPALDSNKSEQADRKWLNQVKNNLFEEKIGQLIRETVDDSETQGGAAIKEMKESKASSSIDLANWSSKLFESNDLQSELFKKYYDSISDNLRDSLKRKIQNELPRDDGQVLVNASNQVQKKDNKMEFATEYKNFLNLKKEDKKIEEKFIKKKFKEEVIETKDIDKKTSDFFENIMKNSFIEFDKISDKYSEKKKINSNFEKYKNNTNKKINQTDTNKQKIVKKASEVSKETASPRIYSPTIGHNQSKLNLMSFDKIDLSEEERSQSPILSARRQSFLQKIKQNQKKRNKSNLKKFIEAEKKDNNIFVETLKKKFEPKKIIHQTSKKIKLYKKNQTTNDFKKNNLKKKLLNKFVFRKKNTSINLNKSMERMINKKPNLKKINSMIGFSKDMRTKSLIRFPSKN